MSMEAMKANHEPCRIRLSVGIVIERDGEGYHAFCPALKGLHVDGETQEIAFENALEAAEVYIASLVRRGEPLPVGPHLSMEREEQIPHVPAGALLRHLELQWPFNETSGIS